MAFVAGELIKKAPPKLRLNGAPTSSFATVPAWAGTYVYYIEAGVHVVPMDWTAGSWLAAGGVAQGGVTKSKKPRLGSASLGCAASRRVRYFPSPMKLSSTNLMTAV